MKAWLGVASGEHVRRGIDLSIAQIGHGKRGGLARMHPGDTLVYYSPVERLGDKTPLRQFTAIGVIQDGEIWQADEGTFRPFRRHVHYEPVTPVLAEDLRSQLHLMSVPNWGYQLRRGLIQLDEADVTVLRVAMCGEGVRRDG